MPGRCCSTGSTAVTSCGSANGSPFRPGGRSRSCSPPPPTTPLPCSPPAGGMRLSDWRGDAMAERNSWAVSDASRGVITTEDARLAVNALVQAGPTAVTSRNGIRPGQGEPGLVTVAPTPNKTVTVQPFQMFMRPTRGIGSYVQTLDAVKELDLLTEY